MDNEWKQALKAKAREIAPHLPAGWTFEGFGEYGQPQFKNGLNSFWLSSNHWTDSRKMRAAAKIGIDSISFSLTRSGKSIASDIKNKLLTPENLEGQAKNAQAKANEVVRRELMAAKIYAFEKLGFRVCHGRGTVNMHTNSISLTMWNPDAIDMVELHNVSDAQLLKIMQIMETKE